MATLRRKVEVAAKIFFSKYSQAMMNVIKKEIQC